MCQQLKLHKTAVTFKVGHQTIDLDVDLNEDIAIVTITITKDQQEADTWIGMVPLVKLFKDEDTLFASTKSIMELQNVVTSKVPIRFDDVELIRDAFEFMLVSNP